MSGMAYKYVFDKISARVPILQARLIFAAQLKPGWRTCLPAGRIGRRTTL